MSRKHAWVTMTKTASGLGHLQKCETCGGRRVAGSDIYVNAEGDLIRMKTKPEDE